MEIITSTKNEKIKNIAALLKSKKERDTQGVFVIEGLRLVKDTLKTAPQYIECVFVSESCEYAKNPRLFYENIICDEIDVRKAGCILHDNRSELAGKGRLDENKIYIVKDSVLDSVSGTVTSQGIMAIVRKPEHSLEEMFSSGSRFLVLENIQDPGNLGTMLRTAEAAGMDGIIMSPDCTDIYSPKVVRSSMGSIFRMPFIYCTDFISTLNKIKEHGITIYAAYLHGGVSYKDTAFAEKHAILIGNEGNGLTDEAVEAADKRVFIPMSGEIESLNAAVAAAILMYK